MQLKDAVIESERLLQRVIRESDAADIFREFTHEVTLYMYPQPPETIDGTLEFIRTARLQTAANENLQMVILKKETGEFIGCSGLHETFTKTPELGIWIKRSAAGNAYGLEAISALIEWARCNLQYQYLKYPVDKRNSRSRRIAERNGGIPKIEYVTKNEAGGELQTIEYHIT